MRFVFESENTDGASKGSFSCQFQFILTHLSRIQKSTEWQSQGYTLPPGR